MISVAICVSFVYFVLFYTPQYAYDVIDCRYEYCMLHMQVFLTVAPLTIRTWREEAWQRASNRC